MAVLAARRVFRVCRARYARLDGSGARLVGGRWNSSGRAVVYMAESIALAVLENLVHMTRQDYPRGYVCVAAVLPAGISVIHEKDLRKHPALEDRSTEQLGDWWLDLGGHFKTGHRGSLQNRPTEHHPGRTCFTLPDGCLATPI
jgi:hypothetical protein